jgi:hypothetical protein
VAQLGRLLGLSACVLLVIGNIVKADSLLVDLIACTVGSRKKEIEPEIWQRISVRCDTRSKLAFWGNFSHNFLKLPSSIRGEVSPMASSRENAAMNGAQCCQDLVPSWAKRKSTCFLEKDGVNTNRQSTCCGLLL